MSGLFQAEVAMDGPIYFAEVGRSSRIGRQEWLPRQARYRQVGIAPVSPKRPGHHSASATFYAVKS